MSVAPSPVPSPRNNIRAALVTADGLHGRIVDDTDRFAEGLLEIEMHPTGAEIVRVCRDPAVEYESRVPNGHGVVRRSRHNRRDSLHHLFRRQLGPGIEPVDLAARADPEFHVRAPDIDDQNPPRRLLRLRSSCFHV